MNNKNNSNAGSVWACLTLSCLLTACGGSDAGESVPRLSSGSDPTLPVTTVDPTNLCAGLVTDKLDRPMASRPKPALGQAVTDPQFKTVVRRITNTTGTGVIKPVYSTIPAWNADESYLILYHTGTGSAGHHLYNGKTYQHIKLLNIDPADLEQFYWDTSDPRILYYADRSNRQLIKFNVDTEVKTVLHDFKNAPTSCTADLHGGTDPMFTSWTSPPTIGLACGNKHFAYDIGSGSVSPIAALSSGGNAPQASPDGTRFYLNVNDSRASIRDWNMTEIAVLSGVASAEHGDVTQTEQGAAFVAVQFDQREGIWSFPFSGGAKLIYGPANGWPYPPVGTHVSGVAYRRPGWIAVSHIGQTPLGATVLENEVVLANVNTGTVCRVAHHHSCGQECGTQGYWAEPHASISPTGTRILFASDWQGGSTVDTYVVELPSYQP